MHDRGGTGGGRGDLCGVDARGRLFLDGVDGSLHEAAGGLRGDAELVADLAVAALAAVVEAETLLDGVTRPGVEYVEEAGDEVVLLPCQQHVLGAGLHIGDEVDELGPVVVADGAVEGGGGGETVEAGMLFVELVAV